MANGIDLLKSILRANHGRQGVTTLAVFDVVPEFFAALRADALDLVARENPSRPDDGQHVTNWTKPYGRVKQYSLFNESGYFYDTSRDHDRSRAGKGFRHADRYPTLARFIALFPDAFNFRLNLLDGPAGLSPHQESVVWRRRRASTIVYLRARFHLPVTTTPQARLLLRDELVHFPAGVIHFFNNGAVHAAENPAGSRRIHLVWDMLLTQRAIQQMFGDSHVPQGLQRRVGKARSVPVIEKVQVRSYSPSGPVKQLHERMRLSAIGIPAHVVQNALNPLAYFGNRFLGRIKPTPTVLLNNPDPGTASRPPPDNVSS